MFLEKINRYITRLLNGTYKKQNVKNKFQKVSYSQSGEDLIIKFIFNNILGIKNPSYIDIGANHPFDLNNTAIFYLSGSRGINIEPNPDLIDLFNSLRKEDTNINIGISGKKEELMFFYHKNPQHSTFDPLMAEQYKEGIIKKQIIPTDTINNIVDTYLNGIFPDLLNIDVEGMDLDILKSINYEKSPPKVICVETIVPVQPNLWTKNEQIILFLESKGYFYHSDTRINSIFVLKKLMKHKFV